MNTPEKSQAIGLVLISAILIAYFYFFSPSQEQDQKSPQARKENRKFPIASPDNFPEKEDTNKLTKELGSLASYSFGTEKPEVLENKDLRVVLSNKGGSITEVELKKYKTYRKKPLILADKDNNRWDITLPRKDGKLLTFSSLYFTSQTLVKGDTQQVIFTVADANGSYIKQTYSLTSGSYELGYKTELHGFSDVLAGTEAAVTWNNDLKLLEKDMTQSRQSANVDYYLADGYYKTFSETNMDAQKEKLATPANWFAFKQKFFVMGYVSEGNIRDLELSSEVNTVDTHSVKYFSSAFRLSLERPITGRFYFGPNKLNDVRAVTAGFEENLYLGWPVINIVNRYLMAPLMGLLEGFLNNYGVIIILLVLIIKLVLFPLSYKAYYSMAKIKVLKPEMDEIKSRVGDDMQAMQQEQMKLYQKVGVNPFSGCIPVLLQMPVLLAMFNFFPNAIELRQQPFLWADDLSTYDVIAMLPFSIPAYGDHISLFTLLMTASTLLYTWYNNQVSTATGPMLIMSYTMPVVFMFVLNSMPSGLSFYYFVSNMVTIAQQFVIKQFVNESDIREKLEKNKQTSHLRKPNRFQQRLQEAMQTQEETRKKSKK